MFFKFLKRETAKPAEPTKPVERPKPRRASKPEIATRMPPVQPGSLQVTEGSDHSDWALWEDSVAALDSQMGALQPRVKLYRDPAEAPTDFQDLDPFAGVRNKDP